MAAVSVCEVVGYSAAEAGWVWRGPRVVVNKVLLKKTGFREGQGL
jgi:hypothetical protein